MKRALVAAVVLAAAIGMTHQHWAGAAGQPASKAAVQVADIDVLTEEDQDWTPVLTTTLKTPGNKDLFVDVSLECGLLTRTKVLSQEGILDSSSAEGSVKVAVVLDSGTPSERVALPGETTFCKRTQELSAKYAGIENCEENENGEEECEFTPEETELLLDTMNANSFNYLFQDVPAGVHTISVQAKIDLETESMEGEAEALAAIGYGSVTVETVRLARNAQIDLA